jgi:hypothetical protein
MNNIYIDFVLRVVLGFTVFNVMDLIFKKKIHFQKNLFCSVFFSLSMIICEKFNLSLVLTLLLSIPIFITYSILYDKLELFMFKRESHKK